MKKNDHISIYESGIKSIQRIGETIYGCTPNEILIVNKDNTVERIPYHHEEIYRIITDGVRVYGKDMYGGTYSINEKGISKLSESVTDFYNSEIKRIKKEKNYYIVKSEKTIIDLGTNKVIDYAFNKTIGVFIYWKDRNNHEIVAIDKNSNKEIWRKKLNSEDKRVQQIVAINEVDVYLTGNNGLLYKLSTLTGIFDELYNSSKSKFSNIPIAKLDRSKHQLIHPEIEIDIRNDSFFSRTLKGKLLDNGANSIEHYFHVTDYTFNNEHIYFQVHSYQNQHDKTNTSKIIQLKRSSNEILSKFYINPDNRSIDAKQLILLDNEIVILDVFGKLMKKRIKYET